MPLISDGPYRAAIGAFHTRSPPMKEAISPSYPIRPRDRICGEICYDAAATHCLTLGRNQPIGEAEGSEPGGIKGMSLRPVGCIPNPAILQRGEERALKKGARVR